ncbi:MAG TPA: hypothetical protein ENG11_02410, partial [candidate division Zixibacteria bacterium]|nr:hypothetical protein [candidate division Zixibacteria bacterium]
MATNSLLEHIFANGIDLGTGVLAYGSAGVRASGTHFGAITNAKGIGLVSHSESNVSAYFVENVVSGGSYASILQPEDSEQPVITYSVVAKGKTIMFSGSAQFVNDTAVVNFDEDMANLIDESSPIVVSITPNQLINGSWAVISRSSDGFVAVKNGGGEDVRFDYVVIATLKDLKPLPEEIADQDL